MQAFFWLILKDQRVLDLIISELEKAQEDGRIPKSGRISYAEAGKLTYFQAALKESMRLRPGVGISLYRDVPEPGFTIKGEHVPPGTTLAINGWAVHQDTGVFGYDADKFRPERWLEDPERARRMNQYMVHVSCTKTCKGICALLTMLDLSLVEEVTFVLGETLRWWK